MRRRRSVLAALLLGAFTARVHADSERISHIVVPFPIGGWTDLVGRHLARQLSEQQGGTVIVENVTGADGAVAVRRMVSARPDGSTLLLANPTVALVASELLRDSDDLGVLTLLFSQPYVLLVRKALGVHTTEALLALSQTPFEIKAAIPGAYIGLLVRHFEKLTGIQWLHVGYRGSAPAHMAVARNEVDIVMDPIASSIGSIRSGIAMPLAVSGPRRSSLLPGTPTLAEVGFSSFNWTSWQGLMAPPKLTLATRRLALTRIERAVSGSNTTAFLATIGAEREDLGPTPFQHRLRYEAALIRELNTQTNQAKRSERELSTPR